jgi:hypothetical protein
LPALHRDHVAVHVQTEPAHEPAGQFAHRQAVPHRQRAGADETLPSRLEGEPLHRAARRVGAVEHNDFFSRSRGIFQHVLQRGDEGVDAAAEILQVDQQHVESVQHFVAGTADVTVQAEHRDAVNRVPEIVRLDHVVLLVAAQAVLRAEGSGEFDAAERGQGVHGVRQVASHRGGMGEQGHALAVQRFLQFRVAEQAVDSEIHHAHPGPPDCICCRMKFIISMPTGSCG